MLRRARIRSSVFLPVSGLSPRLLASSCLSSSSSSSSSLSGHVELYRIVFGRRPPKTLYAKPSAEQRLLRKIVWDNSDALKMVINHKRQFDGYNVKRRMRREEATRDKTSEVNRGPERHREVRMSLFLDLARQHRLLLKKDTVMAVAEYFAKADCYASFMASYGLMKDPSDLFGM